MFIRLLGLFSVYFILSSSSVFTDYSLRLAGSADRCSGRIEIFFKNSWGTVCDNDWNKTGAEVVCSQLGCGPAISATHNAYFGKGSGQIWLDNVICSGNETSLTQCSHSRFGTHTCGHDEDAGVICEGPRVRLAGSSDKCSGRVEISYISFWGTVCDDHWDLKDADVVCRQLGCGKAMAAMGMAFYGQGTGQIWLDEVNCSSNEASLLQCQHNPYGVHDCQHDEDAGVACSGPQVRLVGASPCSGRVEIFYNTTWGTVCDDSWDLTDAEVVCRELGCGAALDAPTMAYFGQGTGPIWLDDVTCSGKEASLLSCQSSPIGTHNCGHYEEAGALCSGPQVRVVGPSWCSGRVEIFYSNEWGTVCDESWDLNDAEVVCRELGCGAALQAPTMAYYGQGTGPIWLDNVACLGKETSLLSCQSSPIGSHRCGHYQDAGVSCSGAKVRLAGSSRCSGRVEISIYNQWGTVCDDYWDLNDAKVVCRQLGCGPALNVTYSAYFGQGKGPIWLDDVDCTGSEIYLSSCSHKWSWTNNCGHGEDAGVICSETSQSSSSPLMPLVWLPLLSLLPTLDPTHFIL